MAVFQRDGNFPVENDMLIIRVILGATAGAAIRRLVTTNLHNDLNDLRAGHNRKGKLSIRGFSRFYKIDQFRQVKWGSGNG